MPPKNDKQSLAFAAKAEESTSELLAHYRSRVDDFERERAALLESVEKCSVQASELHRLEWENHKRADEIRDLQKALSDAHNFLFDERQRLLALQAENDDLRLQEMEDRRRIQQLLAYEQPLAGGGLRRNPALAAVMGPNLDHVLLKVESLQAQLDEQKQLAAERVAALLEDRRIREGEEAAHRAHAGINLDSVAAKLKKTEEMLRQTTKDYILARRDKQAAESRALASEAELQHGRAASYEEVSLVKRSTTEEVARTKQQAESRLEDVSTNLRQQLKQSEDEVISLSSVQTSLKTQYEKRIAELEGRGAKLGDQNRTLELRRHLDMEGWAADVAALRRAVNTVDRKLHEMRLIDRLEDDERLDNILGNLRRKAPPMPAVAEGPDVVGGRAGQQRDSSSGGGGGGSEASSVKSELIKTMRGLRGGLRGLQDQLASKKAGGPGGAAGANLRPRS